MTTFLIWKYHPKSDDKGNLIALASLLDALLISYLFL